MRKPMQRRKDARPAEILEAAFEEFSLHGFAAARLEDIAKRAGITRGLIYAYFQSKEDLFLAVLKDTKGPVFEKVTEVALAKQGSATAMLTSLFDFFAEQVVENRRGREAARIMFAEGGRCPEVVDRWYADVLQPTYDSVRKIIEYGVEQGEFRPDVPESFEHLFCSPMFYAVQWTNIYGNRHSFDGVKLVNDGLEMLLRSLRPIDDSLKTSLKSKSSPRKKGTRSTPA